MFHDIFVHRESASGKKEKVNAKQEVASAENSYELSLCTFERVKMSFCVLTCGLALLSVVCFKVTLLFSGQLHYLHVCRLLLPKLSL